MRAAAVLCGLGADGHAAVLAAQRWPSYPRVHITEGLIRVAGTNELCLVAYCERGCMCARLKWTVQGACCRQPGIFSTLQC